MLGSRGACKLARNGQKRRRRERSDEGAIDAKSDKVLKAQRRPINSKRREREKERRGSSWIRSPFISRRFRSPRNDDLSRLGEIIASRAKSLLDLSLSLLCARELHTVAHARGSSAERYERFKPDEMHSCRSSIKRQPRSPTPAILLKASDALWVSEAGESPILISLSRR